MYLASSTMIHSILASESRCKSQHAAECAQHLDYDLLPIVIYTAAHVCVIRHTCKPSRTPSCPFGLAQSC